MLAGELAILRRDLRATIRAYAARLEIDLAESMAAVSSKRAEALSREQLHDIRDLTIMVRKRKLKPEKVVAKICAKLIRSSTTCTRSLIPLNPVIALNEKNLSTLGSSMGIGVCSFGHICSRCLDPEH
jgi:hypothetical protein